MFDTIYKLALTGTDGELQEALANNFIDTKDSKSLVSVYILRSPAPAPGTIDNIP